MAAGIAGASGRLQAFVGARPPHRGFPIAAHGAAALPPSVTAPHLAELQR